MSELDPASRHGVLILTPDPNEANLIQFFIGINRVYRGLPVSSALTREEAIVTATRNHPRLIVANTEGVNISNQPIGAEVVAAELQHITPGSGVILYSFYLHRLEEARRALPRAGSLLAPFEFSDFDRLLRNAHQAIRSESVFHANV